MENDEVRLIEASNNYIEPPPMDKPVTEPPSRLIGKTATFGLYMTGPFPETSGQEAPHNPGENLFTKLMRNRDLWLAFREALQKEAEATTRILSETPDSEKVCLCLSKHYQSTEQYFYALEPASVKDNIYAAAIVGYLITETFKDKAEDPEAATELFHEYLRDAVNAGGFPYLSCYMEQAPETKGSFSYRHISDLYFGVPNILHAGSFSETDGFRRESFHSTGFRLGVDKSSLAGNVRSFDENEAYRKVMATMMDTAMTYRNFLEAIKEAGLTIPEKLNQEKIRWLEEFLVRVEEFFLPVNRAAGIDLWLKNHNMDTIRNLLLDMAKSIKDVLFPETKKLYARLALRSQERRATVSTTGGSSRRLGDGVWLDAVQRSKAGPSQCFSNIKIFRDKGTPPSVTILNWASSPDPANWLGGALKKAGNSLAGYNDKLCLGKTQTIDASSCLPGIGRLCDKSRNDWPLLRHDEAIHLLSGIVGLHLSAMDRQPSVVLNVYPGSQGDRFPWVDFINNLGLMCESYWTSIQGISQDTILKMEEKNSKTVLKNLIYSMLLPLCCFSATVPVEFQPSQVHDIIYLSQVFPHPASFHDKNAGAFWDTPNGIPHILARIFSVKAELVESKGHSRLTSFQDVPVHYIRNSVSSMMSRDLAKKRPSSGVSIIILDSGLWADREMVCNDIVEKLYANLGERKVIMGTIFDSRIIQFKTTGTLYSKDRRDGFEILSPESSVLRLVRERTGLEVALGIFAPDPPAMVDKSQEGVLHRHGSIFAFQSAQAVIDEAELIRTLLEFYTLRMTESFLYGYSVRKDRMFLSRSKCVPVYRDKGTCLRVSPEGLAFEEIREALNHVQNGGLTNAPV
jgi:hypothetical protein